MKSIALPEIQLFMLCSVRCGKECPTETVKTNQIKPTVKWQQELAPRPTDP